MAFPSIEPSEVGATGLLWLFLSYGYILYRASNLIAEGSDLLLLVPSVAGIVGSIILPILGAVPDGAIMLFSGLGDIEKAQESLSIGVGALAGSTIMLLTVPWAMSIFAGRVGINPITGVPGYTNKPKVDPDGGIGYTLFHTGVALTDSIRHGALIMMATTIPYFLIQGPALFLHGPTEEIAEGEKNWALAGLIICLVGFVSYLFLQVRISQRGEDKLKRVAVMKKLLKEGKVSLSGALVDIIRKEEMKNGDCSLRSERNKSYESIEADDNAYSERVYPTYSIKQYLEGVLHEAFEKYDKDRNSKLDNSEVKIFFKDFHEDISNAEMDKLFLKYDKDGDGTICFHEFIGMCYSIILSQIHKDDGLKPLDDLETIEQSLAVTTVRAPEDDEEEEDIPNDISDLPPEKQQAAIVKKSLLMLTTGTVLVLLFSDPMVEVLQDVARRVGVSPFYVSFLLAPLAANASEVIASQYYATKKTRKTITVSLMALEGAAAMNNTFCLSIFMGLIYIRGLAWQYTAETIAILVVEFAMGIFVQKKKMTTLEGLVVLSIFPLSLVLVAVLEALGFD